MGRRIGIDLGTTNSVVAILGQGAFGCNVLQNKEAEFLTRSVVGLYKNDYLVGSPALRRYPMAPKDTIISIKRLIGRGISDPEVEKIKQQVLYDIVEPSDGTKDSIRVKLGDKEYSPIDISAKILSKLKSDAEFALGEEVTHAVITVPAYFSEKQKQATREAGLRAGLTVMNMLAEPTAAAIAFGVDSGEEDAKTVLVYDLGGGTFDISVLMMAAGTFAPLNLEGNMWLGGDNFDQIIVDYVLDQVKKEYGLDPRGNLRFMATLKTEAQKAKEALGSSRIAQILVSGLLTDDSGNLIDIDTEITREYFEEKAMPLVAMTVDLTKKAVENAQLTFDDIDVVLMAGNSSCMPIVQHAMENLFGKEKISRKIHPKQCVAMGAAMTAAHGVIVCPKDGYNNNADAIECEKCGTSLVGIAAKASCPKCGADNNVEIELCIQCGHRIGIIATEGAPFNYGVQSAGDMFTVFVRKNDEVPTREENKKFETFQTRYHNQRIISIPVYGGDYLDCASKNVKQGEAFAILSPNCKMGTEIRIMLWLGEMSIFDISAHLDDGTALKSFILRGDIDQKVVDNYAACQEEYEMKKGYMKQEEKIKIDKMRDEVIENLGDKSFDDAMQRAEELKKALGEIKPPPPPPPDNFICGFALYIVNEFGWLLGRAVLNINILISEACESNEMDSTKKEKTDELEHEINKVINANPLLSILLDRDIAIKTLIEPNDAVLANKLNSELNDVKMAFKNQDPQARNKLEAFDKKLKEAIERFKPKCPSCNEMISTGVRYCDKCGADLWAGIKAGSISSTRK